MAGAAAATEATTTRSRPERGRETGKNAGFRARVLHVLRRSRGSIDDAIAALDPAERSAIVLAYAGGLSQSEIAAQLGWPLGTVKTRTRRALGRLREMLEVPVDLDAAIPGVPDRDGAVVDAAPPRPRVVRSAAAGDSRSWNLSAGPATTAPAVSCCN